MFLVGRNQSRNEEPILEEQRLESGKVAEGLVNSQPRGLGCSEWVNPRGQATEWGSSGEPQGMGRVLPLSLL